MSDATKSPNESTGQSNVSTYNQSRKAWIIPPEKTNFEPISDLCFSAPFGEVVASRRCFPANIRAMIPALASYLIKERVGVLKMRGTYDLFDPSTGDQLALAQEKKGLLNIVVGFFVSKRMLPTRIDVHEGADENGAIAFSITRGFSFFRPTVEVVAGDGSLIGTFKTRLLTIGGKFGVFDAAGNEVAQVKGSWLSWDFRFVAANGTELGVVSRRWSGLAKELFTSADNYVVAIHDPNPTATTLLLAAGLAVDTMYKEDEGGGGLTIGE